MEEIRTNQEFMQEVLRQALDFNSQVISLAAVELAGDPSGRNRTHQRKTRGDLQILGHQYSQRLEALYQARDAELRDDDAKDELSDDTRSAIRKTLAILNSRMEKHPGRELADTCNYLQMVLEEDELEPVQTEKA